MRRVVLTREAASDLRRMKKFYRGRWARMKPLLDATIRNILAFPELAPVVGDARRAVCRICRRLSFNIYYSVSGDQILVNAIIPSPIDQSPGEITPAAGR